MFDEEDDEYYDEGDDEYYDDDDYEEGSGGGGRGVVLVLVAMLVLLALGGVFVGIIVLMDVGGDDETVEGAEATPADAVVDSATAGLDTEGDLFTDPGFDLESVAGGDTVDPKVAAGLKTPPPKTTPVEDTRSSRSDGWESDEWSGSSTRRSTPVPEPVTTRYREPPSERRTTERTTPRPETTPRASSSSSSSSYSSEDEGRIIDDDDDTPARRSTPAPEPERTPQPTPAPAEETPAPAEETPAPAEETPAPPPPDANLTYERDSIASLGSKASGGSLSDSELGHLRGVPGDHNSYTLAWATVMKNAEAKRDYKGHCDAATKILELSGNKYHPEWNLEMGKCQMRNGQWEAAVRSIDKTLADSMAMSGSTKTQRVLTAYEIKAVCRTRLYDDNAAANAGAGDDVRLSQAIQAWSEYRNYASGIGNTRALQKAEREIDDLTARREQ
jgi:hypothetical protein